LKLFPKLPTEEFFSAYSSEVAPSEHKGQPPIFFPLRTTDTKITTT